MSFLETKHANLNYAWIKPILNSDENVIVVFLHEALGSIPQFKDFPQLLCDALQLEGLIYEREGYGKSELKTKGESIFHQPRTADYLLKYALEELPQVVEKLAGNKEVILVGHSDGGTIALQYTKAFPTKVKAVITMAAHIINEEVTRAGIQPAIDAYKLGKLKGLEKYHGNKTEELFYAWANTWLSNAYKNWDVTNEMTHQIKPGLIIQGEKDQYGTENQVDLIVDCFEPNLVEKNIIADCGHAPHLEKKDVVISAITNFVNRLNERT